MRSWLSLILFFTIIITCYSAVFLERQLEIPGHENQCYDKENNVFYKKGEEMKLNIKICGRKLCNGSYGRGRVYTEIQTCGKYEVPPECQIKVNLNLPYPDCCGEIICPEFLHLENNNA